MDEWRYSSIILNLSTRWRRVFSFTPCRVTPEETTLGTDFIGGCMSPRVGLDDIKKRKTPCTAQCSSNKNKWGTFVYNFNGK
jgi:hypothetical protein